MNAEWRNKNDLPRSAAFSTAGGGNEVDDHISQRDTRAD